MLNRAIAPSISPLRCRKFDLPTPIVLNNGTRLWSVSGGNADICRVSYFTRGGELCERKPLVAILTALMLYKGYGNTNAFDVAERFDYNGAFHSSSANNDYSVNSFCCLNKNFADILELFVSCIKAPVFPRNELSSLKTRLADSLRVSKQNTSYLASVEMRKQCYGKQHPLGKPVSISKINSITQADLSDFHSKFYNPSQSDLIVSGNVDERILSLVTSAFESLTSNTDNEKLFAAQDFNPSANKVSVVNCPGAVQASIRMRIPTIDCTSPDYHNLAVLVTVLGGYFGSRLNKVIREENGMTYGIGATLSGRKGDSYVEISTDCDVAYTSQVVKAVEREITALADSPVSTDEIDCMKQFMLSRHINQLDSPFKIASHIGKAVVGDILPNHYNLRTEAIESASPSELMMMAGKHLDLSKMRIVVACDKSKLIGYKNRKFHFE